MDFVRLTQDPVVVKSLVLCRACGKPLKEAVEILFGTNECTWFVCDNDTCPKEAQEQIIEMIEAENYLREREKRGRP